MKREYFRNACVAFIGAICLSSASFAQTPYDQLDVGTKLDKGISFSSFAAPLPLPPGDWLVVGKTNSSVNLTGGRVESAPGSTPEVVVALKSQDASNPVELLILTFTPNALPIVWRSPACNPIGTAGFPFKDDFGTLPSGLTYGCARGLYLTSGNRGMVGNLANGTNAINRDLYSGFIPYISSISDSSVFLTMMFSVDKGRRVSYQMHVRAPSSMQKGNAFDLATQAWVHETGLSVQAALSNKAQPIAAFPGIPAAGGVADESGKKMDNAVESTLPGKIISGSIKLDESGLPMPLPPGQWKVAGRREVQPDASPTKSSRVYLTLRNMDVNASIAAAWLVYDSKPYYYSQASTKCESKSTPILENYGTTPESPIASCGMANTFSKSFRQRVINAKTTGTDWDKTNLVALLPYADGLPEAHTWIELRVGANETRRLLFALYTAQPATVSPDGKYLKAVRTWMEKSKDAMTAYVEGKPSSFPPYPDLVD